MLYDYWVTNRVWGYFMIGQFVLFDSRKMAERREMGMGIVATANKQY